MVTISVSRITLSLSNYNTVGTDHSPSANSA
jgi:hypothetical protein